ncbi:Spy0128 family protein [uncultured Holdemanella sp.]|uniref:Spy0128 family protein n=1 Tax=uncultured Holdemanella sp. TaxID=1763549 RepID=UPI0025E09871|nr:FctA domain-containing protein [uncultured Holdemanella sp.]
MKKTTKMKMVLIGLTCLMTAGMQMDVFAEETAPTVNKVCKHFEMAEGIAAPGVTFSFSAEKVTDDAPNATISTLTYSNADTAEMKNGLSSFDKEADITFETFPHAGLYEYTIRETAGTENGITYDTAAYHLNVYVVNKENGNLEVRSITAEKDGAKQEELSFTNTYRKNSSLTISKSTEGMHADKTKDFEFTIKFERAATESDEIDVYTGIIGEETVNCKVDEETTFELHDGESLVFDCLPAGTRYVVKEVAAEDGYTPSIKIVENGVETQGETVSERDGISSAATGTNLVGENENEVVFTNTYEDIPLTGIILNNWPFIILIILAIGALLFSKGITAVNKNDKKNSL